MLLRGFSCIRLSGSYLEKSEKSNKVQVENSVRRKNEGTDGRK